MPNYIKKKKTQQEIDEEMLKNEKIRRAGLISGAAEQPQKKKPWAIMSDRTPEPGSTVLVGGKKGAEAISAKEYEKRKKKKGFLRSLSRIMNRG